MLRHTLFDVSGSPKSAGRHLRKVHGVFSSRPDDSLAAAFPLLWAHLVAGDPQGAMTPAPAPAGYAAATHDPEPEEAHGEYRHAPAASQGGVEAPLAPLVGSVLLLAQRLEFLCQQADTGTGTGTGTGTDADPNPGPAIGPLLDEMGSRLRELQREVARSLAL